MVYYVEDDVIAVLVLAVGKREDDDAYLAALDRLRDLLSISRSAK